jgi:hypothetical protein
VAQLANDAWLVNQHMADAWRLGQRDAYAGLLSEEFRATSHQFGAGVVLTGDRATVVELMFGNLALDSNSSDRSQLLAVRGESLALIAMIVEIDGAQSTILTVSEIANGRALRADSFAHDQLTDAHDLLDRRWVESAPHEAATCEASKRFRHVMALGEQNDVRGFMAEGLVSVDHRSLGAAHRDAEQISDSTGPLAGTVKVLVRKLIAHSGPLLLTWASGTTADGDEYADDLTLHRIDENGRFDIWETFPLDRLDAARRRFAEVDAASALSRAHGGAIEIVSSQHKKYQSPAT